MVIGGSSDEGVPRDTSFHPTKKTAKRISNSGCAACSKNPAAKGKKKVTKKDMQGSKYFGKR